MLVRNDKLFSISIAFLGSKDGSPSLIPSIALPILSRRTGCVRTENTGSNKTCWATLSHHPSGVRPPASWPSELPIVDGPDRVGGQGKPVASWWSGPGRTGALHRRLDRNV